MDEEQEEEEEEEEGRNWSRKVEHHDQEFLLILTGEEEPAQLLHLHTLSQSQFTDQMTQLSLSSYLMPTLFTPPVWFKLIKRAFSQCLQVSSIYTSD